MLAGSEALSPVLSQVYDPLGCGVLNDEFTAVDFLYGSFDLFNVIFEDEDERLNRMNESACANGAEVTHLG